MVPRPVAREFPTLRRSRPATAWRSRASAKADLRSRNVREGALEIFVLHSIQPR
jgi:hypothetical protein